MPKNNREDRILKEILLDELVKADIDPEGSKQKYNTLRKDMLCTLIGNFIYRGCQWGILVALTKFLSAADVGKFALGSAIVIPIVMFAQLNLRAVQVTDVKASYEFGDYFGLRLLSLVVVIISVPMIALSFYRNSGVVVVIILVAVARIIESTSDIIYGIFQKRMRMDIIAKSMIVKGIISLTLLSSVVWLTRSLVWGVAALGISWLCVLIVYDLPRARGFCEVKPKFQLRILGNLAKLAAPLGIVMGLIYLQSNTPKYFIEKYLGEEALGYFAAISYVVFVGHIFMMALGQSSAPRLAKHFRHNLKAFKLLLLKLVLSSLFMGLMLITMGTLFGKWFLSVVYTQQYAQYSDIFIWLLVACALSFVSSMLGYSITAARYFKSLVPQNIVVLIACLICAYFLVPHYGLKGGALTLIITNFVQIFTSAIILVVVVTKKYQQIIVNNVNISK